MMKVYKGKPYSKGEFKSIEKSLEQSLSDDNRELLNHAKLIWESSKTLLPARIPSIPELQETRRKKIDNIKNRLSELIKLLETDGHLITWPHDSYEHLTDHLYLALRFTETAQKEKGKPSKKKITSQKGRTPEAYREDFILTLADIFEKITGEKAGIPAYNEYSGSYDCKNTFFDFAVSCVRPIEIIQDGTLGSAVKKALTENRKHPRSRIKLSTKTGEPNKYQVY